MPRDLPDFEAMAGDAWDSWDESAYENGGDDRYVRIARVAYIAGLRRALSHCSNALDVFERQRRYAESAMQSDIGAARLDGAAHCLRGIRADIAALEDDHAA